MKSKITLLSSNINQAREDIGYSLGVSRVRIASSGCPSAVLMRSPTSSWPHVKIKSAKHSHSAGIHANLGLTPNVQLDGALSRTSGEEKSQSQWKVATRYLPPGQEDGSAHSTQNTVI